MEEETVGSLQQSSCLTARIPRHRNALNNLWRSPLRWPVWLVLLLFQGDPFCLSSSKTCPLKPAILSLACICLLLFLFVQRRCTSFLASWDPPWVLVSAQTHPSSGWAFCSCGSYDSTCRAWPRRAVLPGWAPLAQVSHRVRASSRNGAWRGPAVLEVVFLGKARAAARKAVMLF